MHAPFQSKQCNYNNKTRKVRGGQPTRILIRCSRSCSRTLGVAGMRGGQRGGGGGWEGRGGPGVNNNDKRRFGIGDGA